MFKKLLMYLLRDYIYRLETTIDEILLNIIEFKRETLSELESIKEDIEINKVRAENNILCLEEEMYNNIDRNVSILDYKINEETDRLTKTLSKHRLELDMNDRITDNLNDRVVLLENEHNYVSLPNEDLSKVRPEKIKNGTFTYDIINGNLIERMYVNGEWMILQSKTKEIQSIGYKVDLKNSENIQEDLTFEKEHGVVLIDTATEEKYKIIVDSGYLLTKKVGD